MDDNDIERIEHLIDGLNAEPEQLKEFILPGGGIAAEHCHLARTIARRAEREAVTLSRHDALRPQAVRYLNRLSDYLFVLARKISFDTGSEEVPWKPRL